MMVKLNQVVDQLKLNWSSFVALLEHEKNDDFLLLHLFVYFIGNI